MSEMGYDYPLFIPVFADFALLVAIVAALVQRWPGTPATWAAIVLMIGFEAYFLFVGWMPRWLFAGAYVVGTAVLLMQPVDPETRSDGAGGCDRYRRGDVVDRRGPRGLVGVDGFDRLQDVHR